MYSWHLMHPLPKIDTSWFDTSKIHQRNYRKVPETYQPRDRNQSRLATMLISCLPSLQDSACIMPIRTESKLVWISLLLTKADVKFFEQCLVNTKKSTTSSIALFWNKRSIHHLKPCTAYPRNIKSSHNNYTKNQGNKD
jgi:hypothetical protein